MTPPAEQLTAAALARWSLWHGAYRWGRVFHAVLVGVAQGSVVAARGAWAESERLLRLAEWRPRRPLHGPRTARRRPPRRPRR